MEYANKQRMDKERENNIEHIKIIRSLLVAGEQLEIARETGFSYSHVRHVLSGKYQNPAPAIIRAAENKVGGRIGIVLQPYLPLLRARPDFVVYIEESLSSALISA